MKAISIKSIAEYVVMNRPMLIVERKKEKKNKKSTIKIKSTAIISHYTNHARIQGDYILC